VLCDVGWSAGESGCGSASVVDAFVRQVGQGRGHAGDRVQSAAWERGEQVAGVGMPGVGEHRCGGAGPDDACGVHDGDAVGVVREGVEVVADVQDRGSGVCGRTEQLHGVLGEVGVEIRGGFVGDDDLWVPARAKAIAARWAMPPDSSCG